MSFLCANCRVIRFFYCNSFMGQNTTSLPLHKHFLLLSLLFLKPVPAVLPHPLSIHTPPSYAPLCHPLWLLLKQKLSFSLSVVLHLSHPACIPFFHATSLHSSPSPLCCPVCYSPILLPSSLVPVRQCLVTIQSLISVSKQFFPLNEHTHTHTFTWVSACFSPLPLREQGK